MEWTATDAIRSVIDGLGRTEDIRFSPSGRVMALAGFAQSRVALFEAEVPAGGPVRFTRVLQIDCRDLVYPHGLDFLDEARIVVANREGAALVLPVPRFAEEPAVHEVQPLCLIPADRTTGIHTPGSVAALAEEDGSHTLLFCNNYAHTVTCHRLATDGAVHDSRVLLRRGLETPDGVAVSPDRNLVAVSNHQKQAVYLFGPLGELGPDSEPVAILRGMQFPHGLRFTPDGRHLLVADAGAPVVHLFPRPEGGWSGTRFPSLSLRVMSEELFRRGRSNPEEGGPKGLDLVPGHRVMALSSHHQPVCFLDLAPHLDLCDAYAAIA